MTAFVAAHAQLQKPLPSLHVEGRWLVDTHGNHVVLHGVMDTPNMYFNDYRWGSPWGNGAVHYDNNGAEKCKAYFHKIFEGLEQAKCDVFRLHLDPCWTNDPNKQAAGDGSEADISRFSASRLNTCLRRNVDARDAVNGLPRGIYVVGGKKYMVK